MFTIAERMSLDVSRLAWDDDYGPILADVVGQVQDRIGVEPRDGNFGPYTQKVLFAECGLNVQEIPASTGQVTYCLGPGSDEFVVWPDQDEMPTV
jgi:hypothetical protein